MFLAGDTVVDGTGALPLAGTSASAQLGNVPRVRIGYVRDIGDHDPARLVDRVPWRAEAGSDGSGSEALRRMLVTNGFRFVAAWHLVGDIHLAGY